MFSRKTAASRRSTSSFPVYLNVYDLTAINGYAYWLGLGIYHSGVQVHGVEYAYGAHDHASTGIFETDPRRCPGFAFRKSVLIGRTELGPKEVRRLMEELAGEFTGNTYNLISKNCNHFCNATCLRLAGRPIPRWVNRLARIGLFCHCVLPAHIAPVKERAEGGGGGGGGEKRLRSHSLRCSESPAVTPGPAFSRSTSLGACSLSQSKRSPMATPSPAVILPAPSPTGL